MLINEHNSKYLYLSVIHLLYICYSALLFCFIWTHAIDKETKNKSYKMEISTIVLFHACNVGFWYIHQLYMCDWYGSSMHTKLGQWYQHNTNHLNMNFWLALLIQKRRQNVLNQRISSWCRILEGEGRGCPSEGYFNCIPSLTKIINISQSYFIKIKIFHKNI